MYLSEAIENKWHDVHEVNVDEKQDGNVSSTRLWRQKKRVTVIVGLFY